MSEPQLQHRGFTKGVSFFSLGLRVLAAAPRQALQESAKENVNVNLMERFDEAGGRPALKRLRPMEFNSPECRRTVQKTVEPTPTPVARPSAPAPGTPPALMKSDGPPKPQAEAPLVPQAAAPAVPEEAAIGRRVEHGMQSGGKRVCQDRQSRWQTHSRARTCGTHDWLL